jgi:hypothetical protein
MHATDKIKIHTGKRDFSLLNRTVTDGESIGGIRFGVCFLQALCVGLCIYKL